MRRVHTPVTRRLATQARVGVVGVAATRCQSSATASASPSPSSSAPSRPATASIKIRSRGYGPSHDLVRGLPDHAALSVEATLHPEDAAIQRAVLALAMPSLAAVHVTPVVPHDRYVNKVPVVGGSAGRASSGSGDVMTPTEREVMEQCLQEQLADVANLVVQQVGQRTGQQLDALHVSHTDEMRNFAEIILHSIQDELRQLRVARRTAEKSQRHHDASEAASPAAASPLDVEAVANVVSARVMERLESVVAAKAPTLGQPGQTNEENHPDSSRPAVSADAALTALEQRTTAYFAQLQSEVQKAVSRETAVSHAAPAAIDELRAAVTEAVEAASHAQQESLANIVNDWLADMQHNPLHGDGSASRGGEAAGVDMRALENVVESAVQSSTDELRRIITAEVKKLSKAKSGGGRSSSSGSGADDAADTSELLVEVEKVFDLVQATQSRLTAVDEVVGDVFKEQAATREALQTIQELLQKQLEEVKASAAAAGALTPSSANTAAPTHVATTADTESSPVAEAMASTSTTMRAVEEAVAGLQREVAAAGAMASVHQAETQQHLLTVAQVVSDSVSAAVQQHTAEAVQTAMATVQQQLESLAATAQAGVEAATSAATSAAAAAEAAAANTTSSKNVRPTSPDGPASEAEAVATAQPLSREVLADAVEAVLSPRWTTLAAEVEKMNAANQLALEAQLLQMANSVAASVAAGVQAQLAAAQAQSEAAAAEESAKREREMAETATRTAAATAEAKAEAEANAQRQAEATKEVAVAAATALAEKTTTELASLRTELMSTLQEGMQRTHEVDLTPMYKYIDSVLTFMKEELNMQETSLTAKMTSLADSVTVAVRDAAAAAAQAQHTATSASTAATTNTTTTEAEQPGASPTPASTAEETQLDDTAPTVPAAVPAATPSTLEVPASLTNALDLQSSALRHLEERLNEVSLSQSRDMSQLLMKLQEATADFKAATAAATAAAAAPSPPPQTPSAPLPVHPDQLEWQRETTALLTSLNEATTRRDGELGEAVRDTATTVRDDVAAQLKQLEAALTSSSQEERRAVQIALRDIVAGSAEAQSSRVAALAQRVEEMHAALRDQAVAVHQLQPTLPLRGLTAAQQAAQARIRTDTQEHLRRIARLVEDVAAHAGAEAAAQLQTELTELRALQAEEAAALESDPATPAAATVESIVQAEVAKAQAALQENLKESAQHGEAAQAALSATVNTLLTHVTEVGHNTSSIPSIADIQQLLDATLARLAAERAESEAHVTQLVTEATAKATAAVQTAAQTTLSETLTTAVEQRIMPDYHAKVEAAVQSQLTRQSSAVTAAVAEVAVQTSAAVAKVEGLVRDFNTQRADEAQKILADQHAQHVLLTTATTTTTNATKQGTAAHLPVWWMLMNALLVGVVVLLSLYYVFACLLLAFVPKPLVEPTVTAAAETEEAPPTPNLSDGLKDDGTAAKDTTMEQKMRRGGRYVDRYM